MNSATSDGFAVTAENQSSPAILNIAAYKFVPLENLVELRAEVLQRAKSLDLRGTVLLSSEGINLFVAGKERSVRDFLGYLLADQRFRDLEVKESYSDKIPFNRMLVRLKKEIIAFGVDGIAPHVRTSPKLSAAELKQWLDEKRDLLLLDVRNDFEVEVGTFDNAIASGIDHFRDFEASIDRLPAEARKKPIVMFCTGGIRCEKAGPLMQRKGFENVYQLDGGILKYFEEIGGDHYEGDCFVFDGRVAVDPELQVTGLALCFACQAVLTAEDQASDLYKVGQQCPHCYRTPEQKMRATIESRHKKLAEIAVNLPGSSPHEQRRPIRIPSRLDGQKLIDCIIEMLPQIPIEDWEVAFSDGRILDGNVPARPARTVRSGEEFTHVVAGFIEPQVNADIRILWEDESIVVVDKPAPLPVHPSGRFFHNTLTRLLGTVYRPEILSAVHRLDANTTGVLLLSRRRAITSKLQKQFEESTVLKSYLLKCHGQPEWDEEVCKIPIGIRPGAGRIRVGSDAGDAARTDFKVLNRYEDGTCLVLANPVTGRTNQIRVHMWEMGYPIVGDPIYLPGNQLSDKQLGSSATLSEVGVVMCLHAKRLCFDHPISGQRMEIEACDPIWMTGSSTVYSTEPA